MHRYFGPSTIPFFHLLALDWDPYLWVGWWCCYWLAAAGLLLVGFYFAKYTLCEVGLCPFAVSSSWFLCSVCRYGSLPMGTGLGSGVGLCSLLFGGVVFYALCYWGFSYFCFFLRCVFFLLSPLCGFSPLLPLAVLFWFAVAVLLFLGVFCGFSLFLPLPFIVRTPVFGLFMRSLTPFFRWMIPLFFNLF